MDYFIENYLEENLIEQAKKYQREIHYEGFIENIDDYEQIEFCKKMLESLKIKTGKDIKLAIWLGTKKFVEAFYSFGFEDRIVSYEESEIILSDLDERNLYGYIEMPEK